MKKKQTKKTIKKKIVKKNNDNIKLKVGTAALLTGLAAGGKFLYDKYKKINNINNMSYNELLENKNKLVKLLNTLKSQTNTFISFFYPDSPINIRISELEHLIEKYNNKIKEIEEKDKQEIMNQQKQTVELLKKEIQKLEEQNKELIKEQKGYNSFLLNENNYKNTKISPALIKLKEKVNEIDKKINLNNKSIDKYNEQINKINPTNNLFSYFW